MNRRTMWLAGGAILIAILYVGDLSYRTFIEGPTTKANNDLDRLDRQLQEAADSQLLAKKVGQKMETFSGRALPSDPILARSLYQDWLLKLTERHKMTGISIDASNPIPIEIKSRTVKRKNRLIGHRITYTLHGKTALPQWAQWMKEFEQSGHLHKIKSLTLVPLGNGTELDANVTVEAVSLMATERVDSLSDWSRDPQQESSASDVAAFVSRNIFARGFSKTLSAIRLQAITFNRRGDAEAWFSTGDNKSAQIITLGESLKVPLHEVTLVGVMDEAAKVRVNGMEILLPIGKSVGQILDPMGTVAAEANNTSAPSSDTPKQPSDSTKTTVSSNGESAT